MTRKRSGDEEPITAGVDGRICSPMRTKGGTGKIVHNASSMRS